VSADPETRAVGPGADGRRRRRWALAVVAVAGASAIGGAVVGSQLKSPADAANEREPPAASRITVGVELRTLSATLALAGEIAYREPTPITLAGSVALAEGDTAVVTRVPQQEQAVNEGDALFEISGRPVFVLQGEVPMYRSIGPGSVGDDVLQLETALARLGYAVGTVDTVYDTATEAAIDSFYEGAGFRSAAPSADDDERLRTLRQAVRQAEDALRQAREALATAAEGAGGADLLEAQQSARRARDAVPAARDTAARDNAEAQGAIGAATAARDAAVAGRDRAAAAYQAATQPGAIDPETGEPYTAVAISALAAARDEASTAVVAAQQALDTAVRQRDEVTQQGRAAIQEALDAQALADARLAEASKAPETAGEQDTVRAAEIGLWEAVVDLNTADAEIGTRVPAGEIVFVPTLPLSVTEVTATPGGAATGALATVSSAETEVVGRVSRADADLVTEGAPVVIAVRDSDVELPGTVTYVGPPRPEPTRPPEEGGFPGDSGGDEDSDSGRMQVVVTPDDPGATADHVFQAVRILVDVGSTNGDVLVVPVAAVSVAGDGRSRVEVELEPVTAASAGATEFVEVEVGLTAQGLVEIRPVDGELAEGTRVVVGIESSDRRNESDGDDDELEPLGEPDTTDDA
jgi:peptidoglycan hydrolase-like protein with peptidoglycan-binding domain